MKLKKVIFSDCHPACAGQAGHYRDLAMTNHDMMAGFITTGI